MSSPTSFSPVEFYREALVWNIPGASEAVVRSVASRAYYAALLSARIAAGIGRSRNTHEATIKHYNSRPGQVNRAIGNDLNQLHFIRMNADYDMTPPFRPEKSAMALNLSKKILRALNITP